MKKNLTLEETEALEKDISKHLKIHIMDFEMTQKDNQTVIILKH